MRGVKKILFQKAFKHNCAGIHCCTENILVFVKQKKRKRKEKDNNTNYTHQFEPVKKLWWFGMCCQYAEIGSFFGCTQSKYLSNSVLLLQSLHCSLQNENNYFWQLIIPKINISQASYRGSIVSHSLTWQPSSLQTYMLIYCVYWKKKKW